MIVGRVGLTCVSKSNSRIVGYAARGRGRPVIRKNPEALAFVKAVRSLTPLLLTGEIGGAVLAAYPNRRRDLDVELLWDALQGVAYKNDRQVREKHAYHRIEKQGPHVTFALWRLGGEIAPDHHALLTIERLLKGVGYDGITEMPLLALRGGPSGWSPLHSAGLRLSTLPPVR